MYLVNIDSVVPAAQRQEAAIRTELAGVDLDILYIVDISKISAGYAQC